MKILFTLIFSMLIMSVGAQNYSWTAQESGTTDLLNDVQFFDNMNGWAVGENGTIVATIDGGETWTVQTSGTTEKLRSVYFLTTARGWAVGGSTNLTLLTTYDGGSNWGAVPNDISEEAFLKRIEFYDDMHGFATSNYAIYYTSNGGTNWERGVNSEYIAVSPTVHDLQVVSDTSAFMCGSYKNTLLNTRPGVFDNILHYEGQWTPQGGDEFDTDDVLRSICFTDSLKGFAGGQNGKIYTMEADGEIFPSVWYLNFTTPSGGWIGSIDFFGNDYGVFNTTVEVNQQSVQLIYHSANGGDNWAAPDSIHGLSSATLSAGDAHNVWIAGSAGQIFKGQPKFPVSISDHASFDFSISPNPFTSRIRIESPDSYQGVQLKLYSYSGQVMKSEYIEELQESYELEGLDFLTSGVYFINLHSVDGKLNASKKIVKF